MTTKLLAAGLLLLLLVPAASAVHVNWQTLFDDRDDWETKTGIVGEGHISDVNPPAGVIIEFDFLNQAVSTKEVRESTLLLLVSHSVAYPTSSTGTWLVEVLINGQPFDCEWFIRSATGGLITAVTVTPSFLISCPIVDLADGVYTVTVTRGIAAGSPPAIQSNALSIIVYRQDVVLMSQPTVFELTTGTNALEFGFIAAIVFLGVFLWSRSTDTVVRVFGGVLPLAAGLLLITLAITSGLGDLWGGIMSIGIAFSVLGCYLVARTFYDAFQEASQ